jgi:hypothetical protein
MACDEWRWSRVRGLASFGRIVVQLSVGEDVRAAWASLER